MADLKKYYSQCRITDPSYMVIKRSTPKLMESMDHFLHGRLLDIGCGNKDKQYLAGNNIKEYVGLDHEDCMHDQSKIDIYASAYDIPEKDQSFDSIICTAVLEHLEEPLIALKESCRVLKSDGYAIYTVPFFWHLHEEPRDFYRYTKYGLNYLFESAGYEVIELLPLSGFWITFGSEWSYYLKTVLRGPLRIGANALIAANNLIFPLLDALDRKYHPGSQQWTWMYLVVARKP